MLIVAVACVGSIWVALLLVLPGWVLDWILDWILDWSLGWFVVYASNINFEMSNGTVSSSAWGRSMSNGNPKNVEWEFSHHPKENHPLAA